MNTSSGYGGAAPAIEWPGEILQRIHRVFEYHQSTKLSGELRRGQSGPDAANRPDGLLCFNSAEKIALPTSLIGADSPTLSLLVEGRGSLPESQLDPPHNIRTLATWLYLAHGLIQKQAKGGARWLRTLPSNGDVYPCEIYVAAFSVGGLPAGLYHYDPRHFALERLRGGLDVLAHLKRGRPDLEFLKMIPAALLVSTIFARSSWAYQKRGYRAALLDAGQQIENLMQSAAALGIEAMARLRVSDKATRELIGVAPDAPFEQAEAVQSMVAWTDPEAQSVTAPIGPPAAMPPIARPPAAPNVMPYDSILLAHEDCVLPGVAIRELRPPLTELSPVPANLPAYERPPVEQPSGGKGLGPMLMKRRPVKAFHRKAIARDAFLAINGLALRGPAYYPLIPGGKYAALVRPLWIIHDVTGIDAGMWYYHPPSDRWSLLARGSFRAETGYLCAEQPLAADASAVCVLIANLHYVLQTAGPDSYRLAHLEAGIIGQRMLLAADAQHLGAICNAIFYDDETRKFLGLAQGGWEIMHQIFVGEPVDEEHPAIVLPPEQDEQEQDWRG